ncbi:MAG TPA: ABC transporter permease subunit [Stellaceae bacterium]|jgi:sodium transport system permease protein|nr:ABC transporter permease subunit [Stellaceae bacterium]
MSAILTVFRKETIDHLRDRRSILVAMIYPLMGPFLLGLMFFFVGGSMRVNDAKTLFVPVVHAESAPNLIRYLQKRGASVRWLPEEARQLVISGRLPFALVLPETPAASAGGPLPVRLLTNPSRFDSIVATGRLMDLLNAYQHETLRDRLSASGLSPGIMDVLAIDQENIGRSAGPAVILLTMIPPFLIFTLFTGGVHVALDATCGERDRGSFEPLMMNPVTRIQVLTGKLGATIVFTLMALAVQAIAFWVMLHVVPRESLGLIEPPGAWRVALVVSVCLPIVVFAAATQLLISAVVRSMKEAQTYLGLLPLIPGLAGMVLALAPVQAQPLLATIPTFGQTLLMGQLVRSEAISWTFVGITAVATLVSTGLLLMLGFRLYEREEILFPQ